MVNGGFSRRRRSRRRHWPLTGAAITVLAAVGPGLVLCGLAAGPGMTAPVSLVCTAAAAVAPAERDTICAEFLDFLHGSHPEHGIAAATAAEAGLPRIDLRITGANERSLGLEVTFVAVDGAARAGTPLQVSFYDRASDATMRRRFYQTFLQNNPLPF